MYNRNLKLVIGLVVLLSFGWVAQASSPVFRTVTASKDSAEKKAFEARIAMLLLSLVLDPRFWYLLTNQSEPDTSAFPYRLASMECTRPGPQAFNRN